MKYLALISSLTISFICCNCFAQQKEPSRQIKFLKLSLFHAHPNLKWYRLSFMPAFVIASSKNIHEVGITNVYFHTAKIFQGYKPAAVSNAEFIYLYKRNLISKPSKCIPQLGMALSFEYRTAHFIPEDPARRKEMYQRYVTYAGYGCVGLSYASSKRFFIDADLMAMFWNVQYFEQKDIRPISHQVHVGAEWLHISKYSYIRLGCRFRIIN